MPSSRRLQAVRGARRCGPRRPAGRPGSLLRTRERRGNFERHPMMVARLSAPTPVVPTSDHLQGPAAHQFAKLVVLYPDARHEAQRQGIESRVDGLTQALEFSSNPGDLLVAGPKVGSHIPNQRNHDRNHGDSGTNDGHDDQYGCPDEELRRNRRGCAWRRCAGCRCLRRRYIRIVVVAHVLCRVPQCGTPLVYMKPRAACTEAEPCSAGPIASRRIVRSRFASTSSKSRPGLDAGRRTARATRRHSARSPPRSPAAASVALLRLQPVGIDGLHQPGRYVVTFDFR